MTETKRVVFDGQTLKVFFYSNSEGDEYYVFNIRPFRPTDSAIMNEDTLQRLTMKLMEELQ
jgi:hypothetical protein